MHFHLCRSLALILTLSSLSLAQSPFNTRPGTPLACEGDEIVVCGQLFHTGAPVVLWMDPGGYDAYRLDKHFSAPATRPSATSLSATTSTTNATAPTGRPWGRDREAARARYAQRKAPLTDEEVALTRNGNWTLPLLQEKVDQFVLHYDVAGLSRTCFLVLHDLRNLSVHFMLDIDGTIYQTVDLKEETWHATSSNGRSIGIEIANMGAYRGDISTIPLREWYTKDANGQTRITIPSRITDTGIRTPNFVGRPSRNDLVVGVVQGATYRQYDYTPQQYDSLTKLTATLCTVFPKITIDYPRQKMSLGHPTTGPVRNPEPGDPTTRPSALAGPGEPGVLIPHALTDEQLDEYQGVLGHYHVQTDKQDPGPALQWDRLINGARALMSQPARIANQKVRGNPARYIRSAPQPASQPATEPATAQGL